MTDHDWKSARDDDGFVAHHGHGINEYPDDCLACAETRARARRWRHADCATEIAAVRHTLIGASA